MMVLIVRNVRPSLRGHLSRWLVQPQAGIFVGHLSGRVRDRLWENVCRELDVKGGSAILVHPEASEQGYRMVSHGEPDRAMADFEGLTLPKSPPARKLAVPSPRPWG